jgi:hypothetical protein
MSPVPVCGRSRDDNDSYILNSQSSVRQEKLGDFSSLSLARLLRSWHVSTRKNGAAVYICIEMSMTAAAVALEGKANTTSSSLIVLTRRRFLLFLTARYIYICACPFKYPSRKSFARPNGFSEIRNCNRNSLSSSFITSR